MSSPELDVRYVANLARIDLSEDEISRFQSQLGRVLEYVEQLNSVDVSHVEPTAHANPIFNVFRADEPKPGLEKSAALANAPRQANGLVMVTKVVE
jgi:aspartyl-tRNA(Asn)/glutamyl-tRNA(Gln) amidotransferase subunit C